MALTFASPAAWSQSLNYAEFEGLFGEPVTTSATGKPERISDTPVTMDVITAADIKRSGARDLASLLRTLPGVIAYRGYNGTEPFSMGAVLLNGREISLATFDETFLDALPVDLDEIRQIEVVRGPQSALYGFNSSQGVINIITFDPAVDMINQLRGRVGNIARRDGSAIATVSVADGTALRLTAANEHAHDSGIEAPAGNIVQPDNSDRQLLSANFSAVLPNGDHTTAQLSHSDVALRTMAPEVTDLISARLQSDSFRADYQADTAIGQIGVLASYSAITVPEATTPSSSWFALHDRVSDGKISDLVKIGPDDSLRLEVEARDEQVHNSLSPSPIRATLIAPSAMWEHQFVPGLAVINSVRYVTNTTKQGSSSVGGTALKQVNSGVADNSAMIYRLGTDDTVRVSYARGLALPSELGIAQLGLVSASSTGNLANTGNNLSVSMVAEARVTWDHQIAALGATTRLSLFNQQNGNVINFGTIESLTSISPACRHPLGAIAQICQSLETTGAISGAIDGVEAQIGQRSQTGLQWAINYSLQQIRPHPTEAATQLLPGLRDSETFQKVSASAGYGWQDWTIDLRLLYSSPIESLYVDTVPAPHAALLTNKPVVTLAPHVAWAVSQDLSLDLAADSLWETKQSLMQRLPATYFLTVRWTY